MISDIAKKLLEEKNHRFIPLNQRLRAKYTPVQTRKLYEIRKHLLVGITESGEFLLLPQPEVNVALNVGIYGKKQSGKTIMLSSLTDRIFHNWHARIFFANDSFPMMYHHRVPEESPAFLEQLKLMGQEPKGLPLVLCYPSTNVLNMPDFAPRMRLSIPKSEFITRPGNFVSIDKKDKGIKYFYNLREELLKANNFEQIENIIETQLPDNVKKSLGPKLKAIFFEMIQQQMFDIDNPDSVSSVNVFLEEYGKNIEVDPIVGMLMMNLVPTLVTSHLQKNPYLAPIFEYYMRQIFDSKLNGQPLEKVPVYCMADELNSLMTQDKNNITTEWVSLGGNLNAGLCWACQNYSIGIPHRIRDNTGYGFAFSQMEKDAAEIAADFSLNKSEKRKLKRLNKFEFMALTKEHWLLLDPESLKLTKVKDPIMCKTIPGLSMHRPETWNANFKPRELICNNPSNITVKGNPFLIPYKKEELLCSSNFPKFYQGQNLLEHFWSNMTESLKEIPLDELERKDWIVLQLSLEGGAIGYMISDVNDGFPENSRRLDELPIDLKIQLNKRSKMVRLFGKRAISFGKKEIFFNGVGPWYPFSKT